MSLPEVRPIITTTKPVSNALSQPNWGTPDDMDSFSQKSKFANVTVVLQVYIR